MRKPTRRTCKICKEKFIPKYPNIWWCCPEHGAELAVKMRTRQREKQAAKEKRERARQQKAQRKVWRERKARIKPLTHWINLTQRTVNDLRRETCLANGDCCISCGTHSVMVWHAGHYRTTAAAGQLRFEPDNIWLQCDACNVHKSGNIERYRVNLVKKIGEARVQKLENNNTPHRWTVEELAEIRAAARAGLRELKKAVIA
ncbi:recombination protein NinG [Salmonella enterica subsp. enterica serovar Gloucester]|nr:recombination protein NinG [Salmonella enterica subsp. enterica serovar Gloucester]